MSMSKKYGKIGIIGGLGYQSSLMYYEQIHKLFEPDYDQYGYPELVLISLNLHANQILMHEGKWKELADSLTSKILLLRDHHKVDFCAIASNTPHFVFPQIQQKLSLQNKNILMVSIIESTFEYMKSKGFKKTVLLGTKFTMTRDTYQRVFRKEIEIVTPCEEDMDYIHKKLFDELERGIVKEETKNGFLRVLETLKKDSSGTKLDSVILGCTEIPLLLTEKSYLGLECVNTTTIHIQKIVKTSRSFL